MKNNIRELLIKNNMTEKELADLLGIKEASVSRYINNVREPRISIVIKMAEIFNCKVEDIYYIEDMINTNTEDEKHATKHINLTFEKPNNTMIISITGSSVDITIQG